MSVAFPLSPTPSWYTATSFPTRNGIFLSNGSVGAPSITLNKTGANAYTVRDYSGTIVSSGSVSGTTVTPTAPAGGWICGWYRIYLTGPSNDTLFGHAYGATNFLVVPADSNFPTNPAVGTSGAGNLGESPDYITKGVLGIGTSRMQVNNAAAPTGGSSDNLAECSTCATLGTTYWVNHADGVRTRELWLQFPAQGYDMIYINGGTGGLFLAVYAATESLDGSTIFVSSGPGSSSGTKVQVFFPNSTTLVETYDNLPDDVTAAATINATSTKIKVFAHNTATGATMAATAIGKTYKTGVALVVSTLYPTVKFFEGPANEPAMGPECAHQMRLFQAAVHAGNASAKAIGPCAVNAWNGWTEFLTAGGGAYCDEFAFHDYGGITGGNLPQGRAAINAWVQLITSFGYQTKRRWQTESGQGITANWAVHHPRRAVWKVLQTLLWEQNGIPAERNTPWYDTSHGFWGFPDWLINGDLSLNPQAAMLRTLTAETWAKLFTSALSFGQWGDAMLIGNVYTASDTTSTVVLCAASYMPNLSATFTVSGTAGPLTVVDAWGNTSTVPVVNGRVTIPTPPQPVFIRLPAGAALTVFTISDWPQLAVRGQGTSNSAQAKPASAGYGYSAIDGQFIPDYGSGLGIYRGPTSMPDDFVLSWASSTRFDRVLIWNAMSWQSNCSLLDFDIQTSNNGTTWTTQATVTKTGATSFLHGSDFNGPGCQYETYWDEQWIFDVKLPSPVSAKYLRLHVRSTSYGGEPDTNAITAGGQGNANQTIFLQEVVVLCDDNTHPQYLTQ